MSGSIPGPKARKNLAFLETGSGVVWWSEEKGVKGRSWRLEGEGARRKGHQELNLSPRPHPTGSRVWVLFCGRKGVWKQRGQLRE